MKVDSFNVIVLPEQGGSLKQLAQAGQEGRFIDFYLNRYKRTFAQVHYFSYGNEEAPPGVKWHLVANHRKLHRWLYAFCVPFVHRGIFKNCDVIRIMQLTGALPGILAKLFYRKPVVATYGYRYGRHAFLDGERIRAPLFWLRERLTIPFMDRVIVTTPTLYQHLQRFVKRERILFIPNGVDPDLFKPAERQGEKKKTIVYVGSLTKRKNLSLLIEAVHELRHPARLVLIGTGPEKESLQKLAQGLGLDVAFMGIIPHQELPHYFQAADLFVLPSRSEGHPKALLEAMSCALPCVGTDVPGIRDVIQDGENGLLCQSETRELASKIASVLEDPERARRLGEKARRSVLAHYSLQTLLEKEEKCLQKVAQEAKESIGGWRRLQKKFSHTYGWRHLQYKASDRLYCFLWSRLTRKGHWVREIVRARERAYATLQTTDFPDLLHVELTSRCNFRCVMCSHPDLTRPKQDMPFELFQKIINEFPSNRVESLGFYFFGESTLYSRLGEAIQYAKSKRPEIHTRLRTNGALLDEERSRELLTSGLDALEVSIDGMDKESYEKIMVGGRYEKLVENVKRYITFKKRLRVKQRNFIATIRMKESFQETKRFIKQWSRWMPVEVTELHDYPNAANPPVERDPSYRRKTPCPDVFYHAVIMQDGRVTFCCYDVEGELSVGNVKDQSLAEIWKGPRAEAIRKIHATGDFDKLSICKGCRYGALRSGVVPR